MRGHRWRTQAHRTGHGPHSVRLRVGTVERWTKAARGHRQRAGRARGRAALAPPRAAGCKRRAGSPSPGASARWAPAPTAPVRRRATDPRSVIRCGPRPSPTTAPSSVPWSAAPAAPARRAPASAASWHLLPRTRACRGVPAGHRGWQGMLRGHRRSRGAARPGRLRAVGPVGAHRQLPARWRVEQLLALHVAARRRVLRRGAGADRACDGPVRTRAPGIAAGPTAGSRPDTIRRPAGPTVGPAVDGAGLLLWVRLEAVPPGAGGPRPRPERLAPLITRSLGTLHRCTSGGTGLPPVSPTTGRCMRSR